MKSIKYSKSISPAMNRLEYHFCKKITPKGGVLQSQWFLLNFEDSVQYSLKIDPSFANMKTLRIKTLIRSPEPQLDNCIPFYYSVITEIFPRALYLEREKTLKILLENTIEGKLEHYIFEKSRLTLRAMHAL